MKQSIVHIALVVKDYNESNVSTKVLKIILSYIEFINREVWKK